MINSTRFLNDKDSLLRQAIAAWLVLFLSIVLFATLATIFSLVATTSRELVVTVLLILVSTISVSIHILLYRRNYRFTGVSEIVYSKRQQDSHVSERAVSREHGKDVFIVHGHDQAIKEQVSRFIMSLGLRPIIVSQQPSAGRTIIEQLEVYSKNIRFAVVLLTPDEVSQGRFRARQNVIFELGYFIGKLGRERVCVLYKENVELPSDFHGVLYVPIDSAGGWHLALAEEMIQAHLPVEINKLR